MTYKKDHEGYFKQTLVMEKCCICWYKQCKCKGKLIFLKRVPYYSSNIYECEKCCNIYDVSENGLFCRMVKSERE